MPTLSKTKKETQLVLKWGGISLIIIFLFLVGMRLVTFVKEALTPPAPPDASFGKLPPISFPDQQKESIKYSLDTISGFLPSFSDRAKVYKITAQPPTLLALDKTEQKVAQLGFTSKGTKIAEDIYQWVDQGSELQRQITINIFSSDFTLSSPYLVTPSLQTLNNTDQEKIIELAKSFLSSISLLPQDLDETKTKTTFYSIQKSELVLAPEIENAKIAKVDFFQKDIDNLPIHSSAINFLIGKENNSLKVVDVRYFHKNISDISSTYAIKSSQDAFSRLKKGEAYIALNPQDTNEVVIKNAYLGYYIGEDKQEFLMPIIVFEGENDFLAYVSAVRDEWINN